ncbi:LysR family transcriptional regulator [Leucobacter sp. cx-328]|uniref:LysR substrate-binding domain-containing protein n=1 Tax=unclassified Leucobacter TaxID=2621730 RepID=UPI00165DF12F|nr:MULTISPECIES: LysR substrate-binding domain-containing protein [unclassified Leucobacter]MBC9943642.1 LysR family transcriptional regulator [Leucobacter sp. cx-328]
MTQRFSITLTQLSYFIECAKTLNMTVASQKLHVAQSAVSTAISHLERSLDTTLFIRQHSKGLILTPSGEHLLRDTQQMFGMLTDTIDSINAERNEVRGSITVAVFSTIAPFMIPQLVDRVQQRHPQLELEIIEGDYESNLAAVRGGRAEISVGYALTDAEGIERESVGSVRPYVLLPVDHPLAHESMVELSELADDPFVLLDLPDSNDYFLDILRGAGVTPNLAYRSSSYETVRSMVATGLGYTILNQRPRISQTYTGRSAVAVEILGDVPSLILTVSSLEQLSRSARALAVTDIVREIVAEQPGRAVGKAGE